MKRLCITEYSNYANNFDNCIKEVLEGCEGCKWYISDEEFVKQYGGKT